MTSRADIQRESCHDESGSVVYLHLNVRFGLGRVWFGFGSNITVRCRIRTFRQYLKRTFDEQHNEGPNIDRLVRPLPVVRVDDLELLDMLQSDRPNYPF